MEERCSFTSFHGIAALATELEVWDFRYLSSSQRGGPAAVPAATLITSFVPRSLPASSTSFIHARTAATLALSQGVVSLRIRWKALSARRSLWRCISHPAKPASQFLKLGRIHFERQLLQNSAEVVRKNMPYEQKAYMLQLLQFSHLFLSASKS